MSLVGKSTAGLRFWGDDLDHDEVTLLLGGEPTRRANKGELFEGRNGHQRVARTGMWHRSVPDQSPGDLDLQIKMLVAGLTDDLGIWQDLSSRFNGDVFVGLFMYVGGEGLELSPAALKLMGDRSLKLGLCIYGPLDDDPTEQLS